MQSASGGAEVHAHYDNVFRGGWGNGDSGYGATVLDAETGEDARRDPVSTQHCSGVVFGRVVVKVKKP